MPRPTRPHPRAPPDDERFLVKTMRKGEAHVLLDMLPAYYEHVQRHPHTLLTRFFGVHRITPAHGRAVRWAGGGGMGGEEGGFNLGPRPPRRLPACCLAARRPVAAPLSLLMPVRLTPAHPPTSACPPFVFSF
jgi:hypothetical protein